jgi:hypothetical protein
LSDQMIGNRHVRACTTSVYHRECKATDLRGKLGKIAQLPDVWWSRAGSNR